MTGPSVIAGLLLLGAGTLAMKAAGPVLAGGGRRVPLWIDRAGGILPTALLAALVTSDALAAPVDPARLLGVAAAAALVAVRAPFVVVVLTAAAVAAALRAVGA